MPVVNKNSFCTLTEKQIRVTNKGLFS